MAGHPKLDIDLLARQIRVVATVCRSRPGSLLSSSRFTRDWLRHVAISASEEVSQPEKQRDPMATHSSIENASNENDVVDSHPHLSVIEFRSKYQTGSARLRCSLSTCSFL